MKHHKDLQFCMEELRSLQKRNGIEPEQRGALKKAEVRLQSLRRKANPTRREIFEAVRQVVEAIIDNFVDRG